ncbi:hypothetical protein RYX36_025016 [Vicia faba]
MELADRAVGFLLSIISLSIFTYYTFWVIILMIKHSLKKFNTGRVEFYPNKSLLSHNSKHIHKS